METLSSIVRSWASGIAILSTAISKSTHDDRSCCTVPLFPEKGQQVFHPVIIVLLDHPTISIFLHWVFLPEPVQVNHNFKFYV
jgi:hypothetical protein